MICGNCPFFSFWPLTMASMMLGWSEPRLTKQYVMPAYKALSAEVIFVKASSSIVRRKQRKPVRPTSHIASKKAKDAEYLIKTSGHEGNHDMNRNRTYISGTLCQSRLWNRVEVVGKKSMRVHDGLGGQLTRRQEDRKKGREEDRKTRRQEDRKTAGLSLALATCHLS